MNAPLRRLAMIVTAMFTALMVAATWVQFVDAGRLRDDPRNSRTLYEKLGRERGAITTADGTVIAQSEKVDDRYQYQRKYPKGDLYSAVTGTFSVTTGASGLEAAEDKYLSGTSDRYFFRRVSDLLTGTQPSGAVVETTLRDSVQQAAADGLGNQQGAVVALDPKTGAVLALYSSPGWDPNALASHDRSAAAQARAALEAEDSEPLVSKATRQSYPPGSTFKLITTAAALESGDYTADSLLDGPAELTLPQTSRTLANDDDRPCGTDGKTSLADALRVSCNTAYASLGMTLGQDVLREQAEKFGFNAGFDIPIGVAASTFPTGLDGAQLARSAIGQDSVTATPMQMAMVAAAIANGGVVMQPNLVRTVRGRDLEVLDAPSPDERGRAVSRQTAASLTAMMEGVVESGTGRRAQIPGVSVAGKTGTAQTVAGAAPHAWFTAFAPADDPKVAVAVLVENGGNAAQEASGGSVAAPIAKSVIQAALAAPSSGSAG
ncbi:cell elongation-specific peptidoglycan D,D-transpeptidase [Quadrisphaera granulorum]|uniref:Cell elongation-specific peptidoglycan D,D-transpeptidase n=1 Tax=Quadrisphaera granulorum TaxID=317664 RepID=A0A316AFR1_9ACTN|nr:penicillin-binding protein 2 [Quadrisphaera granulorum]PWJ55744.1 cell elongation-specific peptidoglycan D,D-transpeptidase [Quadrisphaera granulorum]SZE95241.1 cell elongation-specific peptidoglycan D,D-transpeptidase [Quadrisphaera granulorum]